MKTQLLTLLAACALTIGAAAAQTTTQTALTGQIMEGRGRRQGNPEQMAQHQSERLTQELGLNADQAAKVQQILLARGQEMQTLRDQPRNGANRGQMREQMQANHTKYEEQFKAVLTADQYTKFTTLQDDRRTRGGQGYGPGADGGKMKAENGKVSIKQANK